MILELPLQRSDQSYELVVLNCKCLEYAFFLIKEQLMTSSSVFNLRDSYSEIHFR